MIMKILFLIFFLISTTISILTLFLILKRKKYIINYKTILIFLFPFLFGSLLFTIPNKKNTDYKKNKSKKANSLVNETNELGKKKTKFCEN